MHGRWLQEAARFGPPRLGKEEGGGKARGARFLASKGAWGAGMLSCACREAELQRIQATRDASVGARTNIGAGTITCNYDGFMKHQTTIGADVFIGSDTMLVAPVTVGDSAMTATGTVVTSNVEPDAIAMARAKQENRLGSARKLRDILRAKKARLTKDKT